MIEEILWSETVEAMMCGCIRTANASLLAAAPDLLNACTLAGPVIDSFLNGQGGVSEAEMDEALMAIRDALAKAYGAP